MWPFPATQIHCPVDPEVQEWIDGRLDWLRDQLGRDVPRKVRIILPTPEFFPDPYEGRPDDAQGMLIRVAGYMNVDPDRFKLFIYSEANPEPPPGLGPNRTLGSAGVYIRDGGNDRHGNTRAAIGIESSQLSDPMALVATLAHEVGHEILLGQKRVSADQQDHEPLTDLVTVFRGMGIFGANATIRDGGWSTGTLAGWSTKRLGYLNQRMFGYALARFAWIRNETRPSWIRHVRPDVRAPLKNGLKFLAAR
jgi:hypothetical protein